MLYEVITEMIITLEHPSITLSQSAGVTVQLAGGAEGGGTSSLVRMTAFSGSGVTVGDYYVMDGTNIVGGSGDTFTAVFPAGVTQTIYTIVAASDTLIEGDGTLDIYVDPAPGTSNLSNSTPDDLAP